MVGEGECCRCLAWSSRPVFSNWGYRPQMFWIAFIVNRTVMFQTLPWWIQVCKLLEWRFQWPRGVRSGSAAARLLGLWVRIPPGAWMFVSCECCVLSGRGSLRRTDHLSRGVPPSVTCLNVIHFKYEPDDFLRSKRCQRFMNKSTEITEREREREREGGREMKTNTPGCRIPVFA